MQNDLNNLFPLVKFCGLRRKEDATLALKLNADFAGFIFSPQSKRYISPEEVSQIETGNLKRVGVFVNEDAKVILKIIGIAKLDFVQLHGEQGINEAEQIDPHRIIRVMWPERYQSISQLEKHMETWDKYANYFLFDAGKFGGGHGRKMIVSSLSFLSLLNKKSFLAGGLSPDNISGFWPNKEKNLVGFDFNSGVEISPGIKNHRSMEKVMKILGKTMK
jgi:phosphoribosylanthranilate isomerase